MNETMKCTLQQAIADAKYLGLYYGEYREAWLFKLKNGVHVNSEGCSIDDFIANSKEDLLLSVTNGLDGGNAIKIEFLDKWKWRRKEEIILCISGWKKDV